MSELDNLKAELVRAQKAFKQNPVPALSTVIRRLAGKIDQMAAVEKKSKSGRRAIGADLFAGYQKNRLITVDDRTADLLKAYGSGNLSAGVRMAAALVDQTTQAAGRIAKAKKLKD